MPVLALYLKEEVFLQKISGENNIEWFYAEYDTQ